MASDSSLQRPTDLTVENVGEYLVSREVFEDVGNIDVHELGGGVSNVVLVARQNDRRVVVKQALGRLRVADEWLATKERAITEGEALGLADRLIPNSVPAVLDLDRESCALTISEAPASWKNWKEQLLRGNADPLIAARLGEWLGSWQVETFENPDIKRQFASYQSFEELRIEPFYETSAQRRPELRASIDMFVENMRARRVCLVHGDFSPKNILVGDGFWVLDFEVAHYGDPVFDVAFMLSHLFVKRLHFPTASHELEHCIEEFWSAYQKIATSHLSPIAYVIGHVGCLMVARVDGKSPVEYLTIAERDTARQVGSEFLLDPPNSIDEALTIVARVARRSE
jgi:5-methylthioribose kinase